MSKFSFHCRWGISLWLSVLLLSGCSPSKAEPPRIEENINLDMIGRTDRDQAETRSHYALYSEKICPEIINRIKAANTDPVMWPLVYQDLKKFPGRSDHIGFLERNIPAVFFFSGHHPDLHMPTDDADKIEYDKMQKISQLIYRMAEEFANHEVLLINP